MLDAVPMICARVRIQRTRICIDNGGYRPIPERVCRNLPPGCVRASNHAREYLVRPQQNALVRTVPCVWLAQSGGARRKRAIREDFDRTNS